MRGGVTNAGQKTITEDRATQPMDAVIQLSMAQHNSLLSQGGGAESFSVFQLDTFWQISNCCFDQKSILDLFYFFFKIAHLEVYPGMELEQDQRFRITLYIQSNVASFFSLFVAWKEFLDAITSLVHCCTKMYHVSLLSGCRDRVHGGDPLKTGRYNISDISTIYGLNCQEMGFYHFGKHGKRVVSGKYVANFPKLSINLKTDF